MIIYVVIDCAVWGCVAFVVCLLLELLHLSKFDVSF